MVRRRSTFSPIRAGSRPSTTAGTHSGLLDGKLSPVSWWWRKESRGKCDTNAELTPRFWRRNWAALLPYFKKAQKFHPPQGNSQNEPVDYDATVNGNSGPIEQAYPPWMPAQFVGYYKAVRALGVPAAKDQGNGNNVGTSYIASTMTPDSYRRQTAVGYRQSASSVASSPADLPSYAQSTAAHNSPISSCSHRLELRASIGRA